MEYFSKYNYVIIINARLTNDKRFIVVFLFIIIICPYFNEIKFNL